ncbi:hypothetical protein VPNG_04947 [Cytospora leucostoma]|uniref:Uncharacterized protein n=1 Tax=Cytospora leucostoma TaxID=1230097 RepID=A0A423X7V2_9PEZI|nr:hypothetical protein VPNG_04947 [Cytospora leucostoma]
MDSSTATNRPLPSGEASLDKPLPASVDWTGPDGQSCSLGNSSTTMNFIVDLDKSSRTVLFQLRFEVWLRAQDPKASNMKASLFLRIRPDQIRSVALDDQLPISTESLCLRLELTNSMDLVAPEPKLRPKNKAQSAVLQNIMTLAQQTTFNVHLQGPAELKRDLQWLCESVSNNELRPKDTSAELRTYYRGQGGHVIHIDPSFAQYDTATQSPPAYGDLGTPPPMPPLHERPTSKELGVEGAPSTKRRRLDSTVDGPDFSGLDRLAEIMSTQMNKIEERMTAQIAEMNKRMDDRMARMEERFMKLEDRMTKTEDRTADRMARMEDRIVTRLDQRLGD